MRRLIVTTVTDSMSVVAGHGSRELVTETRGGRPPVWSSRPRGWVVQPKTVPDLVALAEHRGYQVVVQQEVDLAG